MDCETLIADLSGTRNRLRVSGAERVEFLHGQCTNEIRRLHVGESCYAAFLNAKGKMRGEGQVICVADAFLLEVNPGLASSLEKFIITEDVTIEDVSASMSEWLVIDEEAGDEVGAVPARLVTFKHPLGWVMISEGPAPRESMARAMELYRIEPPVPDTVALFGETSIINHTTTIITAEVLEVLRIEAAVPKWGVDMDENTIPIEAGLEARAISYDKGCYIGQETIARIKTYGHVNRRLVQMALTGESIPGRGDKILMEGREVGQVTSAARSLRLGKALALGYVRREFATAGAKLNWNNETVEVLRVCGE
jgi:folate-binding protein YgfZ